MTCNPWFSSDMKAKLFTPLNTTNNNKKPAQSQPMVEDLKMGYSIDPDGKFIRYVGCEDDEDCIVTYYMPIDRHNLIMSKSRPGNNYPESTRISEYQ